MSEVNVKEIMEGSMNSENAHTTPRSRNADYGKELNVKTVSEKESTSEALERVKVYTELANALRERTSEHSYNMSVRELDTVEFMQEQFRLLVYEALDRVRRTW